MPVIKTSQLVFQFMNIGTAEHLQLNVPYVMISITTPGSRDAEFDRDSNRKDILRLQFHDIDKMPEPVLHDQQLLQWDLTLFDDAMAKQVDQFVQQSFSKGITHIMCHCEAGISRSAGVIAAFEKYYHGSNGAVVFQRSHPNRLVYRLLLDQLMKSEKC